MQFENIILTVNEVDDQPALLIHHLTISKSDDPHVSVVICNKNQIFIISWATLYRFERPGNLTPDLRTGSDVVQQLSSQAGYMLYIQPYSNLVNVTFSLHPFLVTGCE